MAKVQKKWVNLDENNAGLVATDVKIDAGNATNIKDYIDASITGGVQVHTDTVDPTVNDDIDNYNVGDVWINTDTDESFRIVDNTDGAAVWIKTSLTVDELSTDALLTEFRDFVTVTDTDITNGYIDMTYIPHDGKIELTPMGGPEQEIGTDFELITDGADDKRVSWSGKLMDGIIAEGDKIQVEYKYL